MTSPFDTLFRQKSRPAVFLAPMADVTNPAFRALCAEHGADFTYTEMISADGLLNGDSYAEDRGFSADGRPYGVQISGSAAQNIAKAAGIIEDMFRPAVIDINMGCPSPRIIKSGCGAFLMTQEGKPSAIVKETTAAVKTPVTVKMRIFKDENATLRLAESIENAGAAALTVHGRTRDMMYSGRSDTGIIRKIRETLSIPVIASGDVRDEASAVRILEETGCSAVMIGRGAIGNPFVFRRIVHFLENKEYHPAALENDRPNETGPAETAQRISDFCRYCDLLDANGLYPHVNIRAQAQWFTTGLPGSREIRLRINDLHKDVKIDVNDRPALTEERRRLADEIKEILTEKYGTGL